MSDRWSEALAAAREHEYCYLTTTGRRTGRAHRIEIWFVVDDDAVWLLTERQPEPDWVRNLRLDQAATLDLGAQRFAVRGEPVKDYPPDGPVRALLAVRYRHQDADLQAWAEAALVVCLREANHRR
jgi:deazaflavin-dependent oxidoreductase (nitroreductase family)